jgi:glycosyltransferase involved in cell wall biosynthesis
MTSGVSPIDRAELAGDSAGSTNAVAPFQAGRIIYDGLNLALPHGTGIATYTRLLTRVARKLGYEVGVVYGTNFTVRRDPVLQDVLFFHHLNAANQGSQKPRSASYRPTWLDVARCQFKIQPLAVRLGEAVIPKQFADLLPELDRAFAVRNLFENAKASFTWTGRNTTLRFDPRPDIFHCTYPMPVRAESGRNIYTIHDLVPLRLPFATNDHKRHYYAFMKSLTSKADHIVTVSECSKRDIVELLGIDEQRVTNTYQAVSLPRAFLERSDAAISRCIENLQGLEMQGYLLFFGALEPKKNVSRLLDAYMLSGVSVPLVLVTGRGWQNAAELQRLESYEARPRKLAKQEPSIRRLDYVDTSTLVNLIRGARAVVFPSLYEGFGLPALESMMLGTPVVASASGGLGEVVGDAGMLVDPYDVDDIARGIRTIVNDADLRHELRRRGAIQANRFSLTNYQDRVGSLYKSLI